MDYRIDDLARAAGTTVRTVRAYQERGLLPAPRLVGRVGYYTDAHLARLRLIANLLEQGFTLAGIGKLLGAWQSGRDLGELLGLEEALVQPWSAEPVETVTAAQLTTMFGPEAGAHVDRAVALGLLAPAGDGTYRVPSPRLLHAGAELVAVGIPLPAVLELSEALLHDTGVIARRLVDTVRAHLFDDDTAWRTDDTRLAELAAVIRRIRPLAGEAVEAAFAAAMQRIVTGQVGERLASFAAEEDAATAG